MASATAPALPEPAPTAALLSPPETAEVVRTLRGLLSGTGTVIPPALNRAAAGVLLTFHSDAPPSVILSERTNLGSALGEAGEGLARRLAERPDRDKALREGRLQVDILLTREPVEFKDRATIWKSLSPGLDGLLVAAGGRTVGFAPFAVQAHWDASDQIQSLFASQERARFPAQFRAERFRAQSFIEAKPLGPVTPFTCGIVAVEALAPPEAVEAVARAGLWFLRTQQKDGAFFPRYTPSADLPPVERYSFADHLRAMIALNMFYEVTGDERFDAAFERALTRLKEANLIRTEDRLSWVALDGGDDATGTALLLSALCGQALTHRGATMSALMRQLAESLTLMTSDDGRLYARIVNARHRMPPYQLRGAPHAEALAALTLLQRVSPGDRTQDAAARLAGILAVVPEFKTLKAQDGKAPLETEPGRFVLTHSDTRTMARVLEALADYGRQTRTEKHLPAIRDLTAQLLNAQIHAARGRTPESIGGVGDAREPGPDTLTTGCLLAAVCAAYDFSMANRRQEEVLATSARRAALFLANMQYRPESLLSLRRPEALAGAFRRTPEDLSVQTPVTAEAVRGLIRAVPVLAENMKALPGAPARPPAKGAH